MQLLALRPRHAWIAVDDVNHRRRLRVLDIRRRRLSPPVLHVVVPELVAEVPLTQALRVALAIHRDPVERAGAGADRLESGRMRQDPIGVVASGAPAYSAHLRAV